MNEVTELSEVMAPEPDLPKLQGCCGRAGWLPGMRRLPRCESCGGESAFEFNGRFTCMDCFRDYMAEQGEKDGIQSASRRAV